MQTFFAISLLNIDRAKNQVYQKLALWGAVFLFIAAVTAKQDPSNAVSQCITNSEVSNDWIRGSDICTRSGNYHLAWSMPMAAPSYFTPNSFINFFTLFMPYFCEPKSVLNGIIFVLTGPVLAAYITSNVNEQAAVWCFFSIIQIIVITGRLLLPKSWRFGSQSEKSTGEPKKLN